MVHPELQVKYHSTHGALAESNHVFIVSGLKHFVEEVKPTEVAIFEMGFGTGLNALLAFRYCRENDLALSYYGVEKYLIDASHIESLDIPHLLDCNALEEQFFSEIHQTLSFKCEKHSAEILEGDFLNDPITGREFNVVFYDAFGPRSQPELWSEETMEKVFQLLLPGGVLTTFCAQGQFRRHLKSAGFLVEKIPGPPGKRDMTRAIKP